MDSVAIDPIEVEVFRHLFQAIAQEMGVMLMRAAFSPNIKERRDHSCALFDGEGRLLAQAAHIPVHLGSMPLSVRAAIDAIDMRPEDTVVLNDPYQGGTHLPDLTMVTPVFIARQQTPAFYVANRAHHADVGGITPGSLPLGRHIDDEGFRCGPVLYTPDWIERFCRASRSPSERRGDLAAQRAANRVGLRRLLDLVQRYGQETLTVRCLGLNQYSARLMQSVVAAIPDGVYEARDVMDDDGAGHRDIRLKVRITVEGNRCRIDFSQTDDQVQGPINAVRAITLSAVFYVMRCLAPADMPTNAGCLEPVEVITRPGSLLDATYPAPVAAGNVETSQRTVDVLLQALWRAIPDRIPAASAGSMNNVAMGSKQGEESLVYYETIGGGSGAGPRWDGSSGVHTHMTNTLNTPIEVLEHAFPVRVTRYHLREQSSGRGRHTGGVGIVREYEFLRPTEVTYIGDRHRYGPYGLAGGEPGEPGRVTLWESEESGRVLPSKVTVVCLPGHRIRVETAGGGGYGHDSATADHR